VWCVRCDDPWTLVCLRQLIVRKCSYRLGLLWLLVAGVYVILFSGALDSDSDLAGYPVVFCGSSLDLYLTRSKVCGFGLDLDPVGYEHYGSGAFLVLLSNDTTFYTHHSYTLIMYSTKYFVAALMHCRFGDHLFSWVQPTKDHRTISFRSITITHECCHFHCTITHTTSMLNILCFYSSFPF